ncbi:MAG: hypothetical protein JNJ58_14405 [Chitinophagaceae bacterium]|nr:hypothetical protein [Chitinophagaceae bacterium]
MRNKLFGRAPSADATHTPVKKKISSGTAYGSGLTLQGPSQNLGALSAAVPHADTSLRNQFAVILSLTLLLAFSACSELKSPSAIEQAHWLEGQWEHRSPDEYSVEIWKRMNDTLMQAENFMLAGKDTMFRESILLQQIGKDVFYCPHVSNQNHDSIIRFKLIMAQGDSLVFENPQHDFPQRICYVRVTKDSLLASISGKDQGQERRIEFPMKKASQGN